MYMFLFDDILLLTRVKKPPRKARPVSIIFIHVCLKSATDENFNGVVMSYRCFIEAKFLLRDTHLPNESRCSDEVLEYRNLL